MSGFYQIPNSTTDFKSRTNDVFAQLASLEKQHDVHAKSHIPIIMPDEDLPPSSSLVPQNPTIPTNAIVSKKRPAETNFNRPNTKWQKYDLSDVNEHHLSGQANRHALNDFLRSRVTTPEESEKAELSSPVVFKRPLRKEISLDNDNDNESIAIRAPLPSTKSSNTTDDDNNDDNDVQFKLSSTRKKTRGVYSTNQKELTKKSVEKQNDDDAAAADDDDDNNNDDGPDEFFEP